MSDRVLVQRMLAGDEQAFDQFFDMNFDRVFRFAARRLRDRSAAEDIAQATLVQAIRKLHTWRGEAALFSWLCAICRRELLAHWQRTGTRPEIHAVDDDPMTVTVLDQLAAGTDNPEQAAQRREVAALVQLALDFLPERYGDVLEWKYLEGASVNDIAERLGLSAKAVESMLTRARDAFREGYTSLARSPEAP